MSSTKTLPIIKTRRHILITITVIVVLFLTIATLLVRSPGTSQDKELNLTVTPPVFNSVAAGCSSFFTWNGRSEAQYITDETMNSGELRYVQSPRTLVSFYGYVSENPLTDSEITVYEADQTDIPTEYEILRTMAEKGTIVVYYVSDLLSYADYVEIVSLVEENDNMMMIPVDTLPYERPVAFATWGISQSCTIWSEDAFDTFIEFANKNFIEPSFIKATPLNGAVLSGEQFKGVEE